MGAQVDATWLQGTYTKLSFAEQKQLQASLSQQAPCCSLHLAASTAKLKTRALNPVLSSDYRDKRWALS